MRVEKWKGRCRDLDTGDNASWWIMLDERYPMNHTAMRRKFASVLGMMNVKRSSEGCARNSPRKGTGRNVRTKKGQVPHVDLYVLQHQWMIITDACAHLTYICKKEMYANLPL